MKAIVNQDTCIGCSLCVGTCPEVFHMEADKAIAISGTVPQNSQDCCRKAAQDCPVTAIEISE